MQGSGILLLCAIVAAAWLWSCGGDAHPQWHLWAALGVAAAAASAGGTAEILGGSIADDIRKVLTETSNPDAKRAVLINGVRHARNTGLLTPEDAEEKVRQIGSNVSPTVLGPEIVRDIATAEQLAKSAAGASRRAAERREDERPDEGFFAGIKSMLGL